MVKFSVASLLTSDPPDSFVKAAKVSYLSDACDAD